MSQSAVRKGGVLAVVAAVRVQEKNGTTKFVTVFTVLTSAISSTQVPECFPFLILMELGKETDQQKAS